MSARLNAAVATASRRAPSSSYATTAAATSSRASVKRPSRATRQPIQRLLQLLLELPEPTYLHHKLVVHDDGRRLAKRDQAPTLAAMREAGVDGRELAGALTSGLLPSGFRLAEA